MFQHTEHSMQYVLQWAKLRKLKKLSTQLITIDMNGKVEAKYRKL